MAVGMDFVFWAWLQAWILLSAHGYELALMGITQMRTVFEHFCCFILVAIIFSPLQLKETSLLRRRDNSIGSYMVASIVVSIVASIDVSIVASIGISI